MARFWCLKVSQESQKGEHAMRKNAINLLSGLLVVILFGLTGCGGGGGSGGSPGGGDTPGATTPTASNVSLSADATPIVQKQLIGKVPSGDTLTYELISTAAGTGYSDAYVNPATGMLYLSVDTSYNHQVSLQYRVTNGKSFSAPATITIDVGSSGSTDNGLGNKGETPQNYALFATDYVNGALYGAPDTPPAIPKQIDLSSNFPIPGNQGAQQSCVGWATAYALKSYQERLELSWTLSELGHLFSPAFIYNQINGGLDKGSLISSALQLIVDRGAATLASMPYSDKNYLSSPSSSAFSEALNYKAKSFSTVRGVSGIKAQLANKRPVVAGITVYSSFDNLKGTDAVYNTVTGINRGGHAVTIVGYDDSKYGGAFKVINSWGTAFGDKGYFWLPYSFVSDVLNEAYILYDGPSTYNPAPDVRPNPTNLPNLTVTTWSTEYDPKPGGSGTLQYEVKNNGTADAPAGFDVCLMLSRTQNLKDTGTYVVCEQIPFSLKPGVSAVRNTAEDNLISFNFPQSLSAGSYYMSVWVDDLNTVRETNESDNWVFGSDVVTLVNSLPDLSIITWYASWDSSNNGSLTYTIENNGASSVPANKSEVSLVLFDDSWEYTLFKEKTPFALTPDNVAKRTDANPGYFDIVKTWDSGSIPYGTYTMAFKVDPNNIVNESDETNNISIGSGSVTLYSVGKVVVQKAAPNTIKSMYNGKVLPSRTERNRLAALSKTAGKTGQQLPPVAADRSAHIFEKTMSSADAEISPTTLKKSMPGLPKLQGR
jgi:C1A family cysteine protease